MITFIYIIIIFITISLCVYVENTVLANMKDKGFPLTKNQYAIFSICVSILWPIILFLAFYELIKLWKNL